MPTVASRWLQRLLALVEAAGLEQRIVPDLPFVEWARDRDRASFDPVKAPRPCPPADARPKKLSVTRIERWIANPYEIFARNILKLEKLKPLGTEPDVRFVARSCIAPCMISTALIRMRSRTTSRPR